MRRNHDTFHEGILELITQRKPVILVTGCSLADLTLENGVPREIRTLIYEGARRHHDMLPVEAKLGSGFQLIPLDLDSDDPAENRRVLSATGLPGMNAGTAAEEGYEPEVGKVRRGFDVLRRHIEAGRDLPPLLIHMQHAHDLVGAPDGFGGTSDVNVALIHSLLALSNNYAARGYKLLIILEGDLDKIDPRLSESVPIVRCPFPDFDEKMEFLRCLQSTRNHQRATLESGMTLEQVANQTTNTPNRSIEELFYASARTGKPVELTQITERRKEDIRRMSEGVFEQEDTRGVENVKLEGVSAKTLQTSLEIFVRGVEQRSPYAFTLVIIAGGPGTSKTVAVQLAARNCTLLKWNSPKHYLVGNSEKRAQQASVLVREMPGNVYIRDEIDSLYGIDRRQLDRAGDSGSSGAEIGELLKLTADEGIVGKALIICITNRIEVIAGAFLSRAEVIPAFRPVCGDYPAILEVLCDRLASEAVVSREDPLLIEAGNMFYQKQLFAREMLRAIRRTVLMDGAQALSSAHVLKAAIEAAEPSLTQLRSFEYAELMALRLSSSVRYFPWYENMEDFEFPDYLVPLVDSEGRIRPDEADAYLRDIQPSANV